MLIKIVMMNDLTLYLDHEDPGIKGSLAKLLAVVLRGNNYNFIIALLQYFLFMSKFCVALLIR